MQKNLLISGLFFSCLFTGQLKPEDQAPVKTIKVEELVDDVIDQKMNTPNLERSTTKFVTDITSMVAAFGGYVASKKILPSFLEASGQKFDEKAIKQMEAPVSILASLVCLRVAKGAIKSLLKTLNWDPRDLAVANKLLFAARSGAVLTSDYNSMKDLLEQVIPEAGLMDRSRSIIVMTDKEKIELSQRIRSCIRAFRKIRPLK